MAMSLKLQAYKNKYNFHRMSVRKGIIRGHYKFDCDKKWSTTELAHIDDVTITHLKNGCRDVANRDQLIYRFQPTT